METFHCLKLFISKGSFLIGPSLYGHPMAYLSYIFHFMPIYITYISDIYTVFRNNCNAVLHCTWYYVLVLQCNVGFGDLLLSPCGRAQSPNGKCGGMEANMLVF